MYKQVNELISLLEAEGKCEVRLINREEHLYEIDSLTGLAWNTRANKFGELQANEEELCLKLDFPVQSFSTQALQEAVDLPVKEGDQSLSSYVDPTFNKASYNTVKIVINRSDVENYSFQNENFISWLNILIDENIK